MIAFTGMNTKWPKLLPPLTIEQIAIKDDFMKYWHEVLPKKYGLIEKFNHGFPASYLPAAEGKIKTLEIGAGLGEYLNYEDLSRQEYHALELRPEMAEVIRGKFSDVKVLTADCQQRLPFADASFDRVIAVHVLEHLPDLPATLREIRRVLKKDGVFSIVIPCEGGLAYSVCRKISAQRIFEKRYKQPYKWLINSEHINLPHEILAELDPLFEKKAASFFPLVIPVVTLNLCIGMHLRPRSSQN